jgi:hypothetical protein
MAHGVAHLWCRVQVRTARTHGLHQIMPLDLPYRFPDEARKIREEALKFRRLSPDERFTRILDLIGSGAMLMADSPKRDIARRLREHDEAEWRRRIKELINNHVNAEPPASAGTDGRPGCDS